MTVGVTGGVAVYRAVELVRELQKAGLDPHVVMTRGAEEFVRPLTFAAVSGHRVLTSLWSGGEVPTRENGQEAASSVEHIEQAQTTAALIIAPATADVLAKLAHGIADDFLTTMYLATEAPVIVAPSMNVVMWNHPAVQANVRVLRERGVNVLGTETGYLACGMHGSGRLAPLATIVDAVKDALAAGAEADLQGETVLITAGGTREPIDSVRFLGNRSSGRMGYALAAEAQRRGARVILIAANVTLESPPGVEVERVSTASEMHARVLAHLPEATVVLKAAAVADFRPAAPLAGKLHREGTTTLTLEPTEDIAAEVARLRAPGTIVVAFAAEIGLDLARGREKLARKGVDAIVVNDIAQPGTGFDSERNAGAMLVGDREVLLPEMPKRAMARLILNEVVTLRTTSKPSLSP